jgi:hypothetical protein
MAHRARILSGRARTGGIAVVIRAKLPGDDFVAQKVELKPSRRFAFSGRE